MIIDYASKQELNTIIAGAHCAFGVFDGVHLGHQFIIQKAMEQKKQPSDTCVVITFDIDPDEMFCPGKLKKLMSNQRRLEALDKLGADYVVVLPFTREFASQTPEVFIQNVFGGAAPKSLHIGSDFRFGYKAQGTVATLKAWGHSEGVSVIPYGLYSIDGTVVTSTTIRSALAACDIKGANKLLGRNFALDGTVEAGRGEGRDMGFRTANISIPVERYSLGEGVYAAYAVTEAGERYKSAVSVGGAPTFGELSKQNIEAHILDFEQDIYGQELILEFVEFLRPMMVFPTVDELISTVMGNIQWCRDNL